MASVICGPYTNVASARIWHDACALPLRYSDAMTRREDLNPSRKKLRPADYAGSLLIVGIAIGIGFLLKQVLAIPSIALLLLIAIQLVAIAYGLWPAMAACIISALAYNFFFIPPLYTFTVADPENVATLFFFTVTALITSNLISRLRAQGLVARSRAKTTEDLYLFSRKLTGVVALDDLLWAAAYQMAMMLRARVVILLPENGSITVRAGYPPEDALDAAELSAAMSACENGSEGGRSTNDVSGAKRLFLPMRTGRGVVGVVGLESDLPGFLLDSDQRRLYDALADQTALALERIALAEDAHRARIEAETEKWAKVVKFSGAKVK